MGKKPTDPKADSPPAGIYACENITRIIHEKARLGIITSLLGNNRGLSFNELKRLCGLSDGNLSRHMLALEKYGFVEVNKGYEGRKPKTIYKLTAFGAGEFRKYLADLEQVIAQARKVLKEEQAMNRDNTQPDTI